MAPQLPFIACTIGEMGTNADSEHRAAMNRLLLTLPAQRKATACVDART